MIGQNIKLLITDFDGTLIDTFQANFKAYQKAFNEVGLSLSECDYRKCFGYRFDAFMSEMRVIDIAVVQEIKDLKITYYPEFFALLRVNLPLLTLIKTFRLAGGKTAIASTAHRKNLINVLEYIKALDAFDLILAGEEIKNGKPSPEIYLNVLKHFDISVEQALVFEDSDIGIQSAKNAGINYITINSKYYAD